MNNTVLLSVIVPVYKAASTLRPCVESILSQGEASLEILLIEDGSPDESGALCDALAHEHACVRAFHQPNKGASAARNAGLCQAKGRYISFVDADDQLMPGLYHKALPLMEQENLAWYGFGVRHTGGGSAGHWPEGIYPGWEALADSLNYLTVSTGLVALLYNKIYRSDLLRGHCFDEALAINEDLLFNLQVLRGQGPFRLDNTPFYLYEDTSDGSLSRQLRTDLLDAEKTTRPDFRLFMQAAGLNDGEVDSLLVSRQADVARLQFFLLTGRKSNLTLEETRSLMRRCLNIPEADLHILSQLRQDPHPLLALPYRFCLRTNSLSLLALYCRLKNRHLS